MEAQGGNSKECGQPTGHVGEGREAEGVVVMIAKGICEVHGRVSHRQARRCITKRRVTRAQGVGWDGMAPVMMETTVMIRATHRSCRRRA
jgi:hypothetical protein